MKKTKLFKTDYVVYNPKQKSLLKFTNGDIIIYGDIHEAQEDCDNNEIVIPCTELPIDLQEILVEQINSNLK